MKKLQLLLLVVVVAFIGCRKENPEPDVEAEVSFVLSQTHQLKDDPVEPDLAYRCWTHYVSYAFVLIDGKEYYLDVFYHQGWLINTETIELVAQESTITIEEFILVYDPQTPDDFSDDRIVMATPHVDSPWGGFVVEPVDKTFKVTGPGQYEFEMEVLCYNEPYHDFFGFKHFDLW